METLEMKKKKKTAEVYRSGSCTHLHESKDRLIWRSGDYKDPKVIKGFVQEFYCKYGKIMSKLAHE